VWDETGPPGTERSKPSRVWETLWAERRRDGMLAEKWTLGTDVVKEEQTPGKELIGCGRLTGPR